MKPRKGLLTFDLVKAKFDLEHDLDFLGEGQSINCLNMLNFDTLTLCSCWSWKQNFWWFKRDYFSAIKAVIDIFVSFFGFFFRFFYSPPLDFFVNYNLLYKKVLIRRLVIISFFASVTPHMCFQSARAHERKAALLTLEWSFSSVTSLMIS